MQANILQIIYAPCKTLCIRILSSVFILWKFVLLLCIISIEVITCTNEFNFHFQAGMHAVRENRYIVLAKDFEKGYKNNIKKSELEHEFYK